MHLLFSLMVGFLPFAVAVTGRGFVWKFLALLFAAAAVGCFLLAPTDPIWWVICLGCWVISWIFGGIARARRETATASDIVLHRNNRR